MNQGKETINDMKKKAIAMLKLKHERTEDTSTNNEEKEVKKRAIDADTVVNNENAADGEATSTRNVISPERISSEDSINKNELINIVQTDENTNNIEKNNSIPLSGQTEEKSDKVNNLDSQDNAIEKQSIKPTDKIDVDEKDDTNKEPNTEREKNEENFSNTTNTNINTSSTTTQDVQMTDTTQKEPQGSIINSNTLDVSTSPTGNVQSNVPTTPAPQHEVKRISFASAKKEIDDFVAQMEKIEEEIKNKYGINLSEFTYEDLLPDEIKTKLIEDFFNRKEIVDLTKNIK